MSGLLDKVKEKIGQHEEQKAQPGNSFEANADNTVNDKVNQVANAVGVPQQDDGVLDEAADIKTNQDIPFGNN